MRRLGAVLLLVVACAALAAAARPLAAEPPATRCYAASEFNFHPGPVRVDLDGDGAPDTASTSASWVDSVSCTATVSVQTASQTYTAPMGTPDFPLIAPPPIAAVVQLQRPRTRLLVVQMWSGAATGFAQLFQLSGGRLIQLDPKPFAFDGSITDRAAIDCARKSPAALVATEARYRDSAYTVSRRFYTLRGRQMRLLPRLTRRYRVSAASLERRFPTFRQSLFRRCALVRPTYG